MRRVLFVHRIKDDNAQLNLLRLTLVALLTSCLAKPSPADDAGVTLPPPGTVAVIAQRLLDGTVAVVQVDSLSQQVRSDGEAEWTRRPRQGALVLD